jgi:drug/metabolite transporter (DMT)-like permease
MKEKKRTRGAPPRYDGRMFFPLLAVALVLELAADWFSKSWSIGGPDSFLPAGIVLYAAGALIMVNAMRIKTLAQTVPTFVISTALATAAMGVVVFGESLSPSAVFGIVAGVIAVSLISQDDEQ